MLKLPEFPKLLRLHKISKVAQIAENISNFQKIARIAENFLISNTLPKKQHIARLRDLKTYEYEIANFFGGPSWNITGLDSKTI